MNYCYCDPSASLSEEAGLHSSLSQVAKTGVYPICSPDRIDRKAGPQRMSYAIASATALPKISQGRIFDSKIPPHSPFPTTHFSTFSPHCYFAKNPGHDNGSRPLQEIPWRTAPKPQSINSGGCLEPNPKTQVGRSNGLKSCPSYHPPTSLSSKLIKTTLAFMGNTQPIAHCPSRIRTKKKLAMSYLSAPGLRHHC